MSWRVDLKGESGGIATVSPSSSCHTLQGHGAGDAGAESWSRRSGSGEDVVEGDKNTVRCIGRGADHLVEPQGHYVLGAGAQDNATLASPIVRKVQIAISPGLDPQRSAGTYASSNPPLDGLPIAIVDALEHGCHIDVLEGGAHLVSIEVVSRWGQMSPIDDHIAFVGNIPLVIAEDGAECTVNVARQEALGIGLAEHAVPGEIRTWSLRNCNVGETNTLNSLLTIKRR